MWKETVVAWAVMPSRYLREETEEDYKTIGQGIAISEETKTRHLSNKKRKIKAGRSCFFIFGKLRRVDTNCNARLF
jgi:hypothetical protein